MHNQHSRIHILWNHKHYTSRLLLHWRGWGRDACDYHGSACLRSNYSWHQGQIYICNNYMWSHCSDEHKHYKRSRDYHKDSYKVWVGDDEVGATSFSVIRHRICGERSDIAYNYKMESRWAFCNRHTCRYFLAHGVSVNSCWWLKCSISVVISIPSSPIIFFLTT